MTALKRVVGGDFLVKLNVTPMERASWAGHGAQAQADSEVRRAFRSYALEDGFIFIKGHPWVDSRPRKGYLTSRRTNC